MCISARGAVYLVVPGRGMALSELALGAGHWRSSLGALAKRAGLATKSRTSTGPLVNRRTTTIVGGVVAALIIILNGFLLHQTFLGWGRSLSCFEMGARPHGARIDRCQAVICRSRGTRLIRASEGAVPCL
jgi:hypothetical protein